MKKVKTILLVDDDEDDRLLLSDYLSEFIKNINIVEMDGGNELFSFLERRGNTDHAPDLILLDMNMPKQNGLEILRKIKEDLGLRQIPVIMISTASHKELVAQAYSHGVNAFMVKPVTAIDYEMMAKAVSICFLNNLSLEQSVFKSQKSSTIVVVEDNDDHWNLLNFSMKTTMPKVNLIRLRDNPSTMEFFANNFKFLNPLPEIILLDLYFPSREVGLNLLEHIRYSIEINKFPQIPIIVFSYSDHQEDIRASYARQANGYLVKPPDIHEWPVFFTNLAHFWSKTISLPISSRAIDRLFP